MLSEAENKRLTSVGEGTPMGELLRRYWMPIAGVTSFTDKTQVQPVPLFGEDLVLYRDKNGTFGLVDRKCPHRRADLSYGYVEDCGLRCNYHGWLFDEDGNCIEQPYEDTAAAQLKFKDKVKIKSYPVKTQGGMVWAYLGPLPAPELPNYEPFNWKNGFVQVVTANIPCNWLQCQENSIDPVHFEWMHMNWGRRMLDENAERAPVTEKIDFEEFDHGFTYHRQRSDLPKNHPMWTIGRVCLWPNGFFLGDHFEWRVPIDDENTLSIAWLFNRVPNEQEPYVQEEIPSWHSEITDPESGRWISSHVMNQDFIAWVGQGVIADRQNEHLGKSDGGVKLLRKRFKSEIKAIEEGKDPKGVIRDPEAAKNIPLPVADRELLIDGEPLEKLSQPPIHGPHLDTFMFQAGQPQEVWDAFRDAMGLERTKVAGRMTTL
jgi:5,5'-dehydrodivanillate O-demethylase